jgi:hypothetical protein
MVALPASTASAALTQRIRRIVHRREVESDAAKLGVELEIVEVRSAADIGPAFETLVRERAHIVLVVTDATFVAARRQIAAFALVARLPTVFYLREHVDAGGLVSYGIDLTAIYHRAAYAGASISERQNFFVRRALVRPHFLAWVALVRLLAL